MGRFIVINLSEPVADCAICNAVVPLRYGIPMWEGMVLPNSYNGEWAGQTVCRRCFEAQGELTEPISKIDLLRKLSTDSRGRLRKSSGSLQERMFCEILQNSK